MTRRILVAILSITALSVVLFGVPLAIVVVRFVHEDAGLRVERQAVLAARQVPGDYRTSGDPVELPAGTEAVALGLYTTDGTLLTGDGPASADGVVRDAFHNRIATTKTSGQLIVAVPVTANETIVGVIRGAQPISRSDRRARRLLSWMAAAGGVLVGLSAVVALVVARRLAAPVRRLRDAAVQLGNGDFTVLVPRSGIPEVDETAGSLESTAQRLDDMVARERAFAADASHQLRTPLAGLRASLEAEVEFPRDDPTVALVEALADVERLENTITELLTIARTPQVDRATCRLDEVLRTLRAGWHGRYAAVGRRLTIDDDDTTTVVRGHAAVLRHVLDVLLDNALVHGAGETRVTHSVRPETVAVSVTDEGGGWDATGTRDGTPSGPSPTRAVPPHGLGLPLARRLIAAMPGRLVIAHSGAHPRVDVVVSRVDEERMAASR
jgi:signal transduction histidine kinase